MASYGPSLASAAGSARWCEIQGERRRDALFNEYRAKLDGSSPRKLTDNPGYDGEPAVCGKDGSIVFTSMRDGDLDLYRMDADGSNVKRLTATPGYDGAAAWRLFQT